jgi:glycine/D-amino acid oxidase-like deaminating enzyme
MHGLRAARRAFSAWRRAALDAAALVRRLGIRAGLESHDCLLIAVAGDEKRLRREHQERHAAGLDTGWLTGKQVRHSIAVEGTGALRARDGFVIDPYRSSIGLAQAALRRGARIAERTPLKKVRVRKEDVEVLVEGGLIRAETVIVTTGTATPEFKPLRRHFKRREAYLVLTEPMPAAMRKQVGRRDVTWRDTWVPRHRVRWTRDDRILVAGADQDETPVRRREAVLVQRTGQLMYELLTMYPAISGLQAEYGWELTYGETADGLMYIGPHRNYPRHLFALGHGGDSVTGAFLAARILARAARGEPEKGDEVFGFTR